MVSEHDLMLGRVYPSLARIREISLQIATAVAETAWESGLARAEQPPDVETYIREMMFEPVYANYLDSGVEQLV
jgi:malate dehydrogenase (oxaloacetate-decarboxylating)(NADP+)